MKKILVERRVKAPINDVFKILTDPAQFAELIPDIIRIEYLSNIRQGLATKFRETRLINRKEQSQILEISEYEEPCRARFLCEHNETLWDTIYSLQTDGEYTSYTLSMEAKTSHFIASLMLSLFRHMIVRGVTADMDIVQQHFFKSP